MIIEKRLPINPDFSFLGLEFKGKKFYEPQGKQRLFHETIINRNQLLPPPVWDPVRKKYIQMQRLKILYGGAAKGGKSVALRWEAHRNCLHYPGCRGLLIRSSLPELRRTHLALDKLYSDFGGDKRVYTFNQSTHIVKYYNGSTLEFGYGENEADFGQYLGSEYDFIMVDELTTIKFDLVIKLMSRLFSKTPDFTPFFAAATNPGDISHREVKSYFIDNDFDTEFPDSIAQGQYKPDTIAFIPATVHDNQIGIEQDPTILTAFEEMSEIDRQRFYYGSWEVFEGQFFDKMMRNVHEIDAQDAPKDGYIAELNAMDYGNFSVGYNGRLHKNGDIFIEWEFVQRDKDDKDMANAYYSFLKERGKLTIPTFGDTDMFNKPAKVYGGGDKLAVVETFKKKGLRFYKVAKTREENTEFRIACNRYMRKLLEWRKDKNGYFTRRPKIYFIRGRCPLLWKTMPMLVHSKLDDRDVDKKSGTHHPFDALKYLVISFKVDLPKEKENVREIMQKRIAAQRNKQRV